MKSDNQNTGVHVEKDEQHLLLDHNYDGIHELDNPLPSWWQITFYGCFVFGILYWVYYTLMGGPNLRDEFNKDYAVVAAKHEEMKKTQGAFDLAKYDAIVAADGVNKGKLVFETNCVSCHKDKGAGDIGPNLTDEYWLWAKGTAETIYPTVFNGVPQNGMPTWGGVLSDDEIYQAVAYVQSLHHTKVAGGKAPQGTKYNDTPEGPVAEGAPVNAPATTAPTAK